jgi:hypothetical protein
MSEGGITVASRTTSLQANLLRTALESGGIQVLLVGDTLSSTVGPFSEGNAEGVSVRVPVSKVRAAHEIIDALEENHGEVVEKEPHEFASTGAFMGRIALVVVAAVAVGLGVNTVWPAGAQYASAFVLLTLGFWSLKPFINNA